MKYILLLFPFAFCYSEFSEDLQKVTDHFSCDSKCTFNESEITSESIINFPKCSDICGILIFNSNLDLWESDLNFHFQSMKTLYGGIMIENTELKSLNFFTTFSDFNFFCEISSFYIRNNSKLMDISILSEMHLWGDQDYRPCDFRVENNPQLDIYKFFEDSIVSNLPDMRNSGNLRDYGCRGDEITASNRNEYKNCEILFGGLILQNLPEISDLSFLNNVKKIIGPIDIQNTGIEDLSFLKNLSIVQVDNIGLNEMISIDIKNNPKMKRFGISTQLAIYSSWPKNLVMNFESLHPEFCLTIEEMSYFSVMKFKNIHAKYCKDFGNQNGAKLCEFEKMSNLDNDCWNIYGTVLIESGDEKYIGKLESVMNIYGSLRIENTLLEDLDFFKMLLRIISLDENEPAIRIVGNRNLKKAHLATIEGVTSRNPQTILIENNHPGLFNSSDSHLLLPPPYCRQFLPIYSEYKKPPKP